jgi:hypothetical protein
MQQQQGSCYRASALAWCVYMDKHGNKECLDYHEGPLLTIQTGPVHHCRSHARYHIRVQLSQGRWLVWLCVSSYNVLFPTADGQALR